MPTPGLFINEYSFQNYASVLSSTRAIIIGGASKGILNTPTLCTSLGELVSKFGPPLTTDKALQAAAQFLKAGNQCLFMRVAHSAVAATRTLNGTTAGTAAVAATGGIGFAASAQPTDGDTITIDDGVVAAAVVFEFDDDGSYTAGRTPVLIGATAAATMANLMAAINASVLTIDATDATETIPECTLTNTTAGVAGNVAVTTSNATDITVSGMTDGADAIAGSTAAVVTITAATTGTWANEVQVKVQATTVPGAAAGNFDLFVYAPSLPGQTAELVETYRNLSLTSTSTRYITDVLADGLADEATASTYVTATVLSNGATITAGTFTLGTGGGTAGVDGITGLVYGDYVGTVFGTTATGLQAAANPEAVEFNVMAIPGVYHKSVLAAVVTLANARRDFVFLYDPPLGLGVTDVCDFVNGTYVGVANCPNAVVNNSYVAVFWPWGYIYDPFTKKNVWLPPSAGVLEAMARNDSTNGPWMPVAGLEAPCSFTRVEYSPSIAERGVLDENRVNPLVLFTGQGVVPYGNSTTQRAISPTSELHTRRMLIHAQKVCATAVRYLVFKPSDPITWAKFEALCNAPLAAIKASRGLVEFRVVCNEGTNPLSQRVSGIMRGKLIIQATPASKRIEMDFASTYDATNFAD